MLITGSKEKTCCFGALAENGQQLFRQYPKCNSNYFIKYLKELQRKFIKTFAKIILYLDRAPWHKSKKAQEFLDKHKDTIQIIWLPKGWPEVNPTEECWRQGKNDDELGAGWHSSPTEFRQAVKSYYRTKRFNLNLYNYLCQ